MLNTIGLLSRFSRGEKSDRNALLLTRWSSHEYELFVGITDARLHRAQTGVFCKNSCSAPATVRIGQADIAAIITKNSASSANSKLFSLAK